jgi:mannosyl-oligosaccharide alpha-1,2-mannosidase
MTLRLKSPVRGRWRPLRLFLTLLIVISIFYIFKPASVLRNLGSPKPEWAAHFTKSGFDWSKQPQAHAVPAREMARPPARRPLKMPRVQYDFPRASYTPDAELEKRRTTVRDAFVRCWTSYTRHAWTYDELTPVTLAGKNTFGGWAATLVDGLDTLLIMGLWDEFRSSLPVIAAMDWNNTTETAINVFETTIRHLGGLLSAYDLSGERVLLLKAIELGDMLYASFDTPNRMPPFWLDFEQAKKGNLMAGTSDPLASPCSLSLEFTRLSQLTGDPKYFDAIDRVKKFLLASQSQTKLPGLWPTQVNFAGQSVENGRDFTLGALADSMYEYLPKMWALVGGHDSSYEAMYRQAMDAVQEHLLLRPMLPDNDPADILFSGDAIVREDIDTHARHVEHRPESQHLSCFAGGMFALGGRLFNIPEHVDIGGKLARGCAWAYAAFPSGIMPEIFGLVPCPSWQTRCAWDEAAWLAQGDVDRLKKGFSHARDPRYILRPEAAESLFLLYRMTGNEEFREAAWVMFQAIQTATRTESANSAIRDVGVSPQDTVKLDQMEVR